MPINEGLLTRDAADVVDDPTIDLIVEVIGGIEPARELILTALKNGKPVVTANKELLANVGTEIFSAADAAGCDLLFEAAVAGGIPLIRPLRESLAGEPVRRILGIVNGTTNYILTRMSEAAPPTPTPSPKRRASATRSAIRRRTSRATTPERRRRSSPPSRSVPGRRRRRVPRGSARSPPTTSRREAARLRREAARDRRAGRRGGSGVRVHPTMLPPAIRSPPCARATTRCSSRATRSAISCSTGEAPGAPDGERGARRCHRRRGQSKKGSSATVGTLGQGPMLPIDERVRSTTCGSR